MLHSLCHTPPQEKKKKTLAQPNHFTPLVAHMYKYMKGFVTQGSKVKNAHISQLTAQQVRGLVRQPP